MYGVHWGLLLASGINDFRKFGNHYAARRYNVLVFVTAFQFSYWLLNRNMCIVFVPCQVFISEIFIIFIKQNIQVVLIPRGLSKTDSAILIPQIIT